MWVGKGGLVRCSLLCGEGLRSLFLAVWFQGECRDGAAVLCGLNGWQGVWERWNRAAWWLNVDHVACGTGVVDGWQADDGDDARILPQAMLLAAA